jgi:hypothetical protein
MLAALEADGMVGLADISGLKILTLIWKEIEHAKARLIWNTCKTIARLKY